MADFNWLSLIIGNSRLHWAWFRGQKLQIAWDSSYLLTPLIPEKFPTAFLPPQLGEQIPPNISLYVASVVPSQTILWQTYANIKIINLQQIPLLGIYPTMGIDRALAVLGTGEVWGFPGLVIDAGTALTVTGVDGDRQVVGGAILPGLRLQLQSLGTETAALSEGELPPKLPQLWALNTPEAIASGIIYTVLAGMKAYILDWLESFPDSQIILTGGDGKRLLTYLQSHSPQLAEKIILDLQVAFWGMRSIVENSIC